jgi:hypothetical protein
MSYEQLENHPMIEAIDPKFAIRALFSAASAGFMKGEDSAERPRRNWQGAADSPTPQRPGSQRFRSLIQFAASNTSTRLTKPS